jgi:hypothetical protein
MSSLGADERIGTADFPSIFHQRPREGMHLHWDGNNTSLAERNLSAALGAGVTPQTVDHDTIDRVANWLLDLRPPPSPNRPAADAIARGRDTFKRQCEGCHGYQATQDYVFDRAMVGQVEPNAELGADPHRLNSYTEASRAYQLANFFKGTKYQFKYFVKTNGYANLPLDGLWLRVPYLHNGSVPTRRCWSRQKGALGRSAVAAICRTRQTAGLKRRRAHRLPRRPTASASTPGCPAMRTAAICLEPTFPKPRSPTSWRISSPSSGTDP